MKPTPDAFALYEAVNEFGDSYEIDTPNFLSGRPESLEAYGKWLTESTENSGGSPTLKTETALVAAYQKLSRLLKSTAPPPAAGAPDVDDDDAPEGPGEDDRGTPTCPGNLEKTSEALLDLGRRLYQCREVQNTLIAYYSSKSPSVNDTLLKIPLPNLC